MSSFRLAVLIATAAAFIGLATAWYLYSRQVVLPTDIYEDKIQKEFVENNLARWLDASPEANGFFKPNLFRNWTPSPQQEATLTSQSKFLYVFSTGFQHTGLRKYENALINGADFLLLNFDNPRGGWYGSVTPKGNMKLASSDLNARMYMIFGLTHAYQATKVQRYLDAALEIWKQDTSNIMLDVRLGAPKTIIPPVVEGEIKSTQPLLVLLETQLVLYEATGSISVWQDILALTRFVFKDLYNREKGFIPDRYDSNWRPIDTNGASDVNIEQQFKWAYLISRAVELGLPQSYLTPSEALIDNALARSYDAEEGGFYTYGSLNDVSSADKAKDWITQCEALRTLAHYATVRQRDDYWQSFDKSWSFVHKRFIDDTYGGWYNVMVTPNNLTTTSPVKGSVDKVGYHETGLYNELLRLNALRSRIGR